MKERWINERLKDQETVPFIALGVFPAIASAMMTIMAIAMTMIRQIINRSV